MRGPNVFRGYWNDPEATAAALTPDGWLRTGDVALEDDDGYLYLVDRIKDLIIVSGFNVYPAEVEAVLLEHPGVAAAAVIGVANPHTGEAVKAYVVPSGSGVDRGGRRDQLLHVAARPLQVPDQGRVRRPPARGPVRQGRPAGAAGVLTPVSG